MFLKLKFLNLAFVVYLCYLYWIEALHPSLVDLFFKSRDDEEQLISDEEEQTSLPNPNFVE